jgi:hypothetical protein
MDLAVHQDLVWWFQACCTHCIKELCFWWCDQFLWWWSPRAAKDFGEVSH